MSRIVGTGLALCPKCGGGLPGDVHDDLVCQCGTGNAVRQVDWQHIETLVHTRSGSRCEIQSPACLAGPRGDLSRLPRSRRSLHHRRPRGMGGTRRVEVHSVAALIDTCGHGTIGCHWYAEQNRTWALDRGLLVPNNGKGAAVDPAEVPLVLPSGRRVLLDEYGGYVAAPGLPYAI